MEFPYNLVPNTLAKAAEVMANFNRLKESTPVIESWTGGEAKSPAAGTDLLTGGAVTLSLAVEMDVLFTVSSRIKVTDLIKEGAEGAEVAAAYLLVNGSFTTMAQLAIEVEEFFEHPQSILSMAEATVSAQYKETLAAGNHTVRATAQKSGNFTYIFYSTTVSAIGVPA